MKNIFFILILLQLILSCTDKNKKMSEPKNEIDSIKSNSKTKKDNIFSDLILSEGNIKIYGDTSIQKNQITKVLLKFEPYISFQDFKVEIENVKAKLDLNSHELGKKFRTAIRNDYDNPESLFAGHYTFAKWGCGSPCQMNVLIDRRNGKIYDAPESSVGSEFRKDSRMLIINPPEEENYYYNDCIYCKPEIYILNEETKKFVKKESKY